MIWLKVPVIRKVPLLAQLPVSGSVMVFFDCFYDLVEGPGIRKVSLLASSTACFIICKRFLCLFVGSGSGWRYSYKESVSLSSTACFRICNGFICLFVWSGWRSRFLESFLSSSTAFRRKIWSDCLNSSLRNEPLPLWGHYIAKSVVSFIHSRGWIWLCE